MRNESPITRQIVSLWCHEDNHDKLYRLELQEFNGKFDVFCMYGRRGGKLTMHIWAEAVSLGYAQQVFAGKLREKLRKGYREIQQDVVEVGESQPSFS